MLAGTYSQSKKSSIKRPQILVFWPLIRRRLLFRIPVEETYFNSAALQFLLKNTQVRGAVMVGDCHTRMKNHCGLHGFFGSHSGPLGHTNECNVNILQCTQFRNVFSVAGKIEELAAISKYVTVAASFVVEKFSRFGAANDVVCGSRFDGPLIPFCCLPVGNWLGHADGLGHRWRGNNFSASLT